ncbi:hypothetical protein C1H46_040219 [Malus baccata]|uniref:Uncharacterized protein n=1 Tax=Malus baccata TaxID=106549 RepID=A0A540KJ55_MALBA|nr:hypothetical protein C1H46_040219 [Malus baccata]
MHFEGLWSSFGFGMDSKCIEQGGWTKLKTKEAKNVKNYCTNDKELSHKRVSLHNAPSLPCNHHCIPFGFPCHA